MLLDLPTPQDLIPTGIDYKLIPTGILIILVIYKAFRDDLLAFMPGMIKTKLQEGSDRNQLALELEKKAADHKAEMERLSVEQRLLLEMKDDDHRREMERIQMQFTRDRETFTELLGRTQAQAQQEAVAGVKERESWLMKEVITSLKETLSLYQKRADEDARVQLVKLDILDKSISTGVQNIHVELQELILAVRQMTALLKKSLGFSEKTMREVLLNQVEDIDLDRERDIRGL